MGRNNFKIKGELQKGQHNDNSTIIKGQATIALTQPDTLHVACHFIPETKPWIGVHYYPLVTDEAAEPQRG